MENPIRMDDLGIPLFSETSISIHPSITNHRSLGGKLISLKPQRGPELSNRRSSAVGTTEDYHPPAASQLYSKNSRPYCWMDGWKKSHSQPPFGCKKWKNNVFLVGFEHYQPPPTGDRWMFEPSTVLWGYEGHRLFLYNYLVTPDLFSPCRGGGSLRCAWKNTKLVSAWRFECFWTFFPMKGENL